MIALYNYNTKYRYDSFLSESKQKIHVVMNLLFCYNMRGVIKCFSFFPMTNMW